MSSQAHEPDPPESNIDPGSAAKPKPSKKQTWLLGCLLPLGLVAVVISVLVAIFGNNGGNPKPAASANTPHATNKTTTRTMAALAGSPAPTSTVASAADRQAAYAILGASIARYQQEFVQGQQIVGHTQYPDGMTGLDAMNNDPNSAAAQFRDWRSNTGIERDISYQDAFGQADKHFTADNEPQAISTWRDDIANAQTDISQWISVATDYQISNKTQADLDQAAAKVSADIAAATADANAVRAG